MTLEPIKKFQYSSCIAKRHKRCIHLQVDNGQLRYNSLYPPPVGQCYSCGKGKFKITQDPSSLPKGCPGVCYSLTRFLKRIGVKYEAKKIESQAQESGSTK